MRNSEIRYRPDIDGLRALAILPVLIYHAAPKLMTGGFVGVDVFFVISGFLITSIIIANHNNGRFSFQAFYARRAIRILPALILVLLSVLVIGLFFATPSEWIETGRQVLAGEAFVSNLWLWRTTDYFNADFMEQPLLHLWSLGVEEQFYLWWPVMLVFVMRWRRWRSQAVAVVALVSFALNLYLVSHDRVAAFYLPVTRLWELLIGGWLATLEVSDETKPVSAIHHVSSILGLTLLLASISLFHDDLLFPGALAVIPAAGAALVIAAGSQAFVNRAILGSKIAVNIGLISYPLYLWHLPMLYLVRAFDVSSRLNAWVVRLGLVSLSIILAVLTWRLVERPIQGMQRRRALVGIAGSYALLALAAFFVLEMNGWRSRFNGPSLEIIDQLETARNSHVIDYREGKCFLVKQSQISDVENICMPKSASVVIWGDSYGAHLYPGLAHEMSKSSWDRSEFLGQLTAGACPPVLSVNVSTKTTRCRAIEDRFGYRILQARPSLVILAASWPAYIDQKGFEENLKYTINRLKLGGMDVLVVGPTGAFGVPLWQLLLHHPLADRAVNPALPVLELADSKLRDIANSTGAVYFSALQQFCDTINCALVVDVNGKRELLSWDTGHLTVPGSIWLAEKLTQVPVFYRVLQRDVLTGKDTVH